MKSVFLAQIMRGGVAAGFLFLTMIIAPQVSSQVVEPVPQTFPDPMEYYDPYQNGNFGDFVEESAPVDLPRYDYSKKIDNRDGAYPVAPAHTFDPRVIASSSKISETPGAPLRSGRQVVDIYCSQYLQNMTIWSEGLYTWCMNIMRVHGVIVNLFYINSQIAEAPELHWNILNRAAVCASNGDELIGCIFLGRIPSSSWQIYNATNNTCESYPMDYYYMDWNSGWEDNYSWDSDLDVWEAGQDGILDTQTYPGSTPYSPSIFVGRIDANNVHQRINGVNPSEYADTVRYLAKLMPTMMRSRICR